MNYRLIQIYQQLMNFLRTLDPLKHLKGRLNFLPFRNPAILQILKLANTISPATNKSQSSLQKYSLEQINALANPGSQLTQKSHAKMLFEAHVHKHSNLSEPIGTIHEQLNKHQKRLVLSLLKFSDKLTVRQIMYLQYALRAKLNSTYPNWRNLHFNRQSQYRRDIFLIPNLASLRHLNDLKVVPKKKVTTAIIASRPKPQQPAAK